MISNTALNKANTLITISIIQSASSPLSFITTTSPPIVISTKTQKNNTAGVINKPNGCLRSSKAPVIINPGRQTDRSNACTGLVTDPVSASSAGNALTYA